ncbi:hypothetical protein EZV62_003548 [Acer yangbiense]|uniref:Uncharacterized protein n=1 Tax=Acer yangbiense TaxID=1000413 RepID=A0A5C7IH67_9ROSI|nr:hypothetical protein EZV62_003548 [Acer yangbiense]
MYLAAQSGDWVTAKSFIEHDPNALTATITAFTKKTVLHVAAYCWQWEFVLKLLELITSPDSIVVQDHHGQTVLHDVAQGGSLKTAKALVLKNANLPQLVDKDGDPPLLYAVWSGNNSNKELVWYLSLKTRFDSRTLLHSLPRILHNLILSGYHDIALYFVQRYPNLVIAKDKDGDHLLYWLATNPSSFFSGSNLGFLERWIYKSPSVKMVRDAKLKYECADELVNHVCTQLSSMRFQQTMHFLHNPKHIMATAVTGGIQEIVKALFLHFPDLINVELMPERNILQAAIEHRLVKIVNIIKDLFPIATKNMSSGKLESGNTTLHF